MNTPCTAANLGIDQQKNTLWRGGFPHAVAAPKTSIRRAFTVNASAREKSTVYTKMTRSLAAMLFNFNRITIDVVGRNADRMMPMMLLVNRIASSLCRVAPSSSSRLG